MKKLLILLSIGLINVTIPINVVNCNHSNTSELPINDQHKDIVDSINLKNNSNNNVEVSDVLHWNNINYKLIDKNHLFFNYDILLKNNLHIFLNKKYRNWDNEIKGNFNINYNTIDINSDNLFLNYSPNNYYNSFDKISAILTGTINDFTLMMNSSQWNEFHSRIFNPDTTDIDINKWLKDNRIYNSNIILQKTDWKNILIKLEVPRILESNYAACIHVIHKSDNFKIVYTNLTPNDEHNMPLDSTWLELFSFKSSIDWNDGSLNSKNNRFICLNNNILNELLDIYNDKTNYHNIYWNISSIAKLLQDNKYANTNLDYNTIAACIFNNWNINLINNFLVSNHNYFILEYDENNNYIKNNWNM